MPVDSQKILRLQLFESNLFTYDTRRQRLHRRREMLFYWCSAAAVFSVLEFYGGALATSLYVKSVSPKIDQTKLAVNTIAKYLTNEKKDLPGYQPVTVMLCDIAYSFTGKVISPEQLANDSELIKQCFTPKKLAAILGDWNGPLFKAFVAYADEYTKLRSKYSNMSSNQVREYAFRNWLTNNYTADIKHAIAQALEPGPAQKVAQAPKPVKSSNRRNFLTSFFKPLS